MCRNFTFRLVPQLAVCLVLCAVQGCGKTPAPVTDGNAQPSPPVTSAANSESPNAAPAQEAPQSATTPAAASAQAADTSRPTTEPNAIAIDETPREPATVEEAVQMLDLRTLPVMEGAEFPNDRTEIGYLQYEVKAELQKVFDFHRKQFAKLGWQELPGSLLEGENLLVHLTKRGYVMQMYGSLSYEPEKKSQGYCSIGIFNYGNAPLSKLPVPASASPHYPMPGRPSYVTTDDAAATRDWCRKSLLEQGWQPYGSAGDTLYFKRNAIMLSASISTHENQPGKTFINYSSNLMSADLPMPADVENSQYIDSMARLTFNCPDSRFDELVRFYGHSFAEHGWKPTTEPITEKRTTTVVYRNAAGDIITLDMEDYDERSRVSVTQQTAAQLAVLEQRLRDAAKKHAAELAAAPEKGAAESPTLDVEAILKAQLGKAGGNATKKGKPSLDELAEAGDVAGLESAIGDLVGGLLAAAGDDAKAAPGAEKPVMEDEDVAAAPESDGVTLRIAAVKVGKCEGYVQRNDDKYEMHHAMAFQTTEFDEPVTVVYVSEQPFRTKGLEGTSVEDMSIFRWQASDSPPSMEMRIRDESVSISCFVEGHSINISGADFKSEAALKEGKLRGKVFSPEPHEFFDDTFQFSIVLDVDLMKTAKAAAPTTLAASEDHEYPVAVGYNEVSSEGSPYRTVIRGTHPAALKTLTEFYRTELTASGWKEDSAAAKLAETTASMSFNNDGEALTVQLRTTDGKTEFALAVRNDARAQKDGIVAKPGKAKLMMANPDDKEIVISVDGKEYKIAAGVGGDNPAEAKQLDVEPGKHTITIKSGNEPAETEEIDLKAGVTWAIVGFPGGGYLSERLY